MEEQPVTITENNQGRKQEGVAITLFILVLIAGTGFAAYKIGMKRNSAEAYMQDFIQAMTTGQFATVYAMLPIAGFATEINISNGNWWIILNLL